MTRSKTEGGRLDTKRFNHCIAPIKEYPKSIFPDFEQCTDHASHKAEGIYAAGSADNSCYKIIGNKLIIVHYLSPRLPNGQTDTLPSANSRLNELLKRMSPQMPTDVVHIIPEEGSGRLDGLFGVGHIRLRVVQGKVEHKSRPGLRKDTTYFRTSQENGYSNELFDPRDIAQSTFNVDDCGRYVATMVGAAVGLASKGITITQQAFKVSPLIKDAAEFSTNDSLRMAAACAAKHPIDIQQQSIERDRIIAQLNQLKGTYEARVKAGKEYKGSFGVIRGLLGGYTAEEKLKAVNELLEPTKGKEAVPLSKAAQQGRLGILAKQLKAVDSKQEVKHEQEDEHDSHHSISGGK